MTSPELLETITEQLSELEPRDVLRLHRRITQLVVMLEREETLQLQGWQATVAKRRRQRAHSQVIAQGQETGQ